MLTRRRPAGGQLASRSAARLVVSHENSWLGGQGGRRQLAGVRIWRKAEAKGAAGSHTFVFAFSTSTFSSLLFSGEAYCFALLCCRRWLFFSSPHARSRYHREHSMRIDRTVDCYVPKFGRIHWTGRAWVAY
jgi:hypothetical protein